MILRRNLATVRGNGGLPEAVACVARGEDRKRSLSVWSLRRLVWPPLWSWKKGVQPWLPEVVLVWLAGVLLAALRPCCSWHTVRRLRTGRRFARWRFGAGSNT